jgi:pyruvate/2-oxoglutarate/acetoin dehydrogenase E1 component
MAAKEGIECEIIDLQTIYPYDADTLIQSVTKTGRCIVTHEAPSTCGVGAEIAAKL